MTCKLVVVGAVKIVGGKVLKILDTECLVRIWAPLGASAGSVGGDLQFANGLLVLKDGVSKKNADES